jgi:asparagine synthase (glutamine-hydrolysing)
MCGIAGAVSLSSKEIIGFDLRRSLSRITHRGHAKAQNEIEIVGNVGLGCHRLPFTSGDEPQPVTSEGGRYKVLLNGELFNFHPAASKIHSSDTKQLANALEQKGLDCLKELDGMFAAIIFDGQENKLHLVRDRIGIKPLYFSSTRDAFLASSEIKGISHFSKFTEIFHVAPGEIRTISLSSLEMSSTSFVQKKQHDLTQENYSHSLVEAVKESVSASVSDRKVYGVLLSGGLDSGLIYALMHEAGVHVKPIVLGSESAEDRLAAMQLCKIYGQEPYLILCPKEADLFRTIHSTIKAVESFEPNTVRQSALSMLLAHGAQAMGLDVVLCGEGADELFGGYPELVQAVDFKKARRSFLNDLHRTQLQRVDRTAMAHTVEVRVPYLSNKVIDIALDPRFELDQVAPNSAGGSRSKIQLREAAKGLLEDQFRLRSKAVLSEGAGLKGNDPRSGMFSELFQNKQITDSVEVTDHDALAWSLKTREERFYFSIFKSFGYQKYIPSQQRVSANASHTVDP